jgi:hypothetical protein
MSNPRGLLGRGLRGVVAAERGLVLARRQRVPRDAVALERPAQPLELEADAEHRHHRQQRRHHLVGRRGQVELGRPHVTVQERDHGSTRLRAVALHFAADLLVQRRHRYRARQLLAGQPAPIPARRDVQDQCFGGGCRSRRRRIARGQHPGQQPEERQWRYTEAHETNVRREPGRVNGWLDAPKPRRVVALTRKESVNSGAKSSKVWANDHNDDSASTHGTVPRESVQPHPPVPSGLRRRDAKRVPLVSGIVEIFLAAGAQPSLCS